MVLTVLKHTFQRSIFIETKKTLIGLHSKRARWKTESTDKWI